MEDLPLKSMSSYERDGLKITLETTEHTVDEVLEAVEYVLKGQGYHLNGHVEIVEMEELDG